jgi:6-phosphogluconate dehydrogenase
MHIGMVGLGKMGLNMTRRLIQGGHDITVFDLNPDAISEAEGYGARPAHSLEEVVASLEAPRQVWVMVPAGGPTEATLEGLAEHMDENDTIIDGGNARYHDTLRRSEWLAERHKIHLVDAGTSGGVWGLDEGYSLMIGGPKSAVEALTPIFQTLAPSADTGWGHVGPSGAGHFTKMVHNGIEYGMMQAFAEGFHILEAKEPFDFDLHQVAEIWRHGSVVRSWLLDLSARALDENADLSGIAPYVSDSGEGRWTVQEAIDLDVPAPVITYALMERLTSRVDNSFSHRMLSALRNQFGGHAIKTVGDELPPPPAGADV